MRRGLNNRKKRKILMKELEIKNFKLLIILIITLLICIIIYSFFFQDYLIIKNFEEDTLSFTNFNSNIPFSISKIVLFSSATAETDSINQLPSLNISQFCDIGIYLNNIDKENTLIKSLYIDDIAISDPEVGTPCLYKKNIQDLGKCSFNKSNIIQNDFYFNIVDSNSDINYSNYELYNNSSTPISLGFYNQDVKQGFIVDKNNEILYNGTLLKNAILPETTLNCNVSFRLNITTNNDAHYICNISFDIPFEDESSSIYETGYITKEFKTNQTSKFIRIS